MNLNPQRKGLKKSLGPEMEQKTDNLNMRAILPEFRLPTQTSPVSMKQSLGELWAHLSTLEARQGGIKQRTYTIVSHGGHRPLGRAIRWALAGLAALWFCPERLSFLPPFQSWEGALPSQYNYIGHWETLEYFFHLLNHLLRQNRLSTNGMPCPVQMLRLQKWKTHYLPSWHSLSSGLTDSNQPHRAKW